MFKIGDIIIGLPSAPYSWTGPGSRNKVHEIHEDGMITVELLDKCNAEGFLYSVYPEYFSCLNTNEAALHLLNKED